MSNSKFTFRQDWDNDGCLVYENAQTLNKYFAINREMETVNLQKRFNMFCAFSNEQFDKGMQSIRPLNEGEKIVRLGSGMFGTRDGIDSYFAFIRECHERIKRECDPQEVYCYEFNNHESMIAYDGDLSAIRIIIDIWGAEIAGGITRKCAYSSLDEILEDD